jgi:CRISPR/Cas system CSM-associated protein Csm3 (group 7 of RAMP superfamily)
MLASTPLVRLARITLETVSPLSLASGGSGSPFDPQIATDANGLPTIPGTALAGALRRVAAEQLGAAEAQLLFGQAEDYRGAPSPLTFTWAHIHDSQDRPVEGLDPERGWASDPLLWVFAASELPRRDHIRLDPRGVASVQEKFERRYVTPGHRFTFEMALWDEDGEALGTHWETLKAILASPEFRVGGATRRGYGQTRVHRCAERRFDLRDAGDYAAYARHPRRLDRPSPCLREAEPVPAPDDAAAGSWLNLDLVLKGEDFWRLGGGGVPLADSARPSETLPYTEERVAWIGSKGHLARRRIVIPASAVKGALAHRSAFHYNRLAGRFVDGPGAARIDSDSQERNPAVRYLFGYGSSEPGSGRRAGRGGGVLIDDAVIDDPVVSRLSHNSLDRYTGGVRDGVFYCEEAVYGGALHLRLRVGKRLWRDAPFEVRQAFRAALDDLAEGRLPLGAGSGRGLGYFQGDFLRDELREARQ